MNSKIMNQGSQSLNMHQKKEQKQNSMNKILARRLFAISSTVILSINFSPENGQTAC